MSSLPQRAGQPDWLPTIGKDHQMGVERIAVPSLEGELKLERGPLQLFWRRRWTVLLVAMLCVGGTYWYLQRLTPTYSSTSRLYIRQNGPRILTETPGALSPVESFLYVQGEMLKSDELLELVAKKPEIRGLKTLAGRAKALDGLKSGLEVELDNKHELLMVQFNSPYAEDAARLVNAVVDTYITFQAEQNRSTAGEVLQILKKEKQQRDQEFSLKRKEMAEFRRANGTLSFVESDKGNIILQRLAKLSEALTEARLETIKARTSDETVQAFGNDLDRIEKFMEMEQAAGGMVPLDSEGQVARQQLREMQYKLNEMLQRGYRPEHTAVRSLQVNIELLTREINAKRRQSAMAYVDIVHQQSVQTQKREKDLQEDFDRQKETALQLNSKAAEYNVLESELKRLEKLCDMIDTRIKELHVTEDVGPMNVRVLEPGKVMTAPSYPKTTQTLGMALVMGLTMGIGCALVLERMDRRVRSAEDVSHSMRTGVLGTVPRIRGRQSMAARGQQVYLEPQSNVAEAYRCIRTGLHFGLHGGPEKKLLVTSPGTGDGKSVTTSNLAIAMAQAGYRTLVVDCDLRRPVQHVIFALSGEAGLTSVLRGMATVDQVIRPSAIERLDVLPAGALPSNPSEMLNSQAFSDVLEELSQRYDHIIIDSPPVMPVTDARILGALCDLTVLVLRAGRSTHNTSYQSLRSLHNVGARVAGIVINDMASNSNHEGYFGGYGYGYGAKSLGEMAGTNGKALPVVSGK